MTSPFFEARDQIQKAVKSAERASTRLMAIRHLLTDPALQREFWEALSSPSWIRILQGEGFFGSPPGVITTESGGTRYAHWPAMKYLLRVAKDAPHDVAAIIASLTGGNPSIWGDAVDAALQMPAEIAATLVPVFRANILTGHLTSDFLDACEICARLATQGQADAAMQLAEALFRPDFISGGDSLSRDEHWYKEGLEKVLPLLVAKRPLQFIPQLCEWLRAAVEAKGYADADSGSDYSYTWRPAIEEHDQNRTYDFAGDMVGFARQALELAIENDSMSLNSGLSVLAKYPFLIFKRLRVHLVNVFGERNPELAREIMTDHALFDDFRYVHEYAQLVGRRFPMLDQQQRREWFRWIENGPDLTDFIESIKSRTGKEATKAELFARRRYWQFERLHWVRNYLDGEWAKFYQEMLREHGEPKLADLNIRMGRVQFGLESPISLEELKQLSFRDAVKTIAEWKPDRKQSRLDIEGLTSTFAQYIASDVERFSKEADALEDRFAGFVRIFISQMRDAVKAGKMIDVSGVLRLCQWVVQQDVQENTSGEEEPTGLVDKNWQWARDAVADFIEVVCQADSEGKPRYQLQEIRELTALSLEPLSKGPSKSYIQDAESRDPRSYDFLTMSMNSPRGKGVAATLAFARWLSKHLKRKAESGDVIDGGLNAMPEVKAILEWQIEPENGSFEAMAAIGSHLGLLYWIDKTWLQAHANAIFDLEKINKSPTTAWGWGAWNAFLVWVQPHIEFYRLLRTQFDQAVNESAKPDLKEEAREQPMQHLGEHLMILYGRGQLGIDEDNGLIRRFLSKTAPRLRAYAIQFVGTTLQGKEELPPDVIDRFRELWEWYWPAVGQDDEKQHPESRLFGYWFLSGRFDEKWSLERLEEFVKIVPAPEPDDLIVNRLAELASVDVPRATRILDRMIRADTNGWRVHQWRSAAKKILALSMKQEGEVREQAIGLIDLLGRRGHYEFGELLKG